MSPGPWGPSPTPPGFRGTRPGAGAPLPHRLRLPLKPLRSGHRFLGSPSQGQAEWPMGGATRGSGGGRRPHRSPGLASRAPRRIETAKAFGSWVGRSCLGGGEGGDTGSRRGGALTRRMQTLGEETCQPRASIPLGGLRCGEKVEQNRAGTRS